MLPWPTETMRSPMLTSKDAGFRVTTGLTSARIRTCSEFDGAFVYYSSKVVDLGSKVPPEGGWTLRDHGDEPPPHVIARRVSPAQPSTSVTKTGTAAASSSSAKQGDDDDRKCLAPPNAEDVGGNKNKSKASSTAQDVSALESAKKYVQVCN